MDKHNRTTSETELVERCKKGEQNAFKKLYDMYKDKVFSTAVRMLGNVQDSEDTTQDIFIKLFKNINNYRGYSSLSTWIYKVAVNTCFDNLRKRKKHEKDKSFDVIDDIPSLPYMEKQPSSVQVIIEKEIQKLPEGYRTVFVLHEVEGFKHEEISKIMNIAPGTSKSQLSAAKSILRKNLLPYMEVLKDEM